MPGGPLTLGLDIGTQGAKAIVYDPRTKRVVARGKERSRAGETVLASAGERGRGRRSMRPHNGSLAPPSPPPAPGQA